MSRVCLATNNQWYVFFHLYLYTIIGKTRLGPAWLFTQNGCQGQLKHRYRSSNQSQKDIYVYVPHCANTPYWNSSCSSFHHKLPSPPSGLLPTPQIRFGWKLSTPFPRKSGYCSPPQPMPIVLVISYNIDLILMVSIPDTRYQDGIQPDSYVAMSEKNNILMTHPSLELPPAPDCARLAQSKFPFLLLQRPNLCRNEANPARLVSAQPQWFSRGETGIHWDIWGISTTLWGYWLTRRRLARERKRRFSSSSEYGSRKK